MDKIPWMEEREALLLNPLQLAYMGDSVWELIVRSRLVFERKNVHHMHLECVQHVNAGAQSHFLALIRQDLTEAETAVVQRGRNAHARHPSPRHQDPADYADATGFEALIGYLYLTGQEKRLQEIQNRLLGEVEFHG